MSVRTRGGKMWLAGGKVASGVSNRIEPTNAALGFVESSFTALTDQAAGTHLFTAQVLNSSVFVLQGYTFSNFRRTAGFSKLSAETPTATTCEFTSNAMVLGDANNVTVTVAVDFTGPSSGTLSATIPGLIEAPPGTGIVVHEFTIHNTSASSVTPRFRLGLAFESGAFPDGFKIKVRDQATQTDIDFAALAGRNTWADASIRSTADAGLVGEDSNALSAGASRLYQAYITNGGQAVSGFNPWTWIAASSDDLTVDVTSRTGFTSGSLGDLAFSLKTAIATTTRREVLCDTARFVRIKAWQKVSGEEHLICEFHVDFWLNGSATPVALEVAPVLSQHWWIAAPFGVTQTKERQTYNAVVKWGSTTLDTRSSLAHAYYCRWASLRSTDDAQHARKHWIDLGSTPMPTVRVQYSDASLKAMMRAGAIPPFRLGGTYTADTYPVTPSTGGGGYVRTYTPLASNGHRTIIDNVGGYIGRGVWSDPDAKLISSRQAADATTAELAWRTSRVMSQSALSVGWHVRDHRTVSGVNGGTDTTNRMIPNKFRKAATYGLSESYSGLAGAAVYSKGASFNPTTGLTVIAHSAPVGGTGAYGTTADTSHLINYGGPLAFLEGEAYLSDAMLSIFGSLMWRGNFNQYAQDRPLWHAGQKRGIAQGIPNTAPSGGGYGSNLQAGEAGTERCLAWTLMQANTTWWLARDTMAEMPWIKNSILHFAGWADDSMAYYSTAQKANAGWFNGSGYDTSYSPWMAFWQGLVGYQCARAFDFCPESGRGYDNVFYEGAEYSANQAAKLFLATPQALSLYHSIYGADADSITMLPDDEWPHQLSATVASNVFTATVPIAGFGYTNGDKVRFVPRNTGFGSVTLPTGITAFTLYYLVNVSGSTFQLATTEGGDPISVANGTCYPSITMQTHEATTALPSNRGNDSRDMMTMALLEEAHANSHPLVTSEVIEDLRTMMADAVANTNTLAVWNYDGRNLE